MRQAREQAEESESGSGSESENESESESESLSESKSETASATESYESCESGRSLSPSSRASEARQVRALSLGRARTAPAVVVESKRYTGRSHGRKSCDQWDGR